MIEMDKQEIEMYDQEPICLGCGSQGDVWKLKYNLKYKNHVMHCETESRLFSFGGDKDWEDICEDVVYKLEEIERKEMLDLKYDRLVSIVEYGE